MESREGSSVAPPGAARQGRWYYGWNIVAGVALSVIVARGFPVSAFSLYVREWSQQLHVPISTLQLMMAPLALSCAVIAPIVGSLADRYPARWLYLAGLGASALLFAAVSAVQAFWQLAVLYAVVLPFTLNLSATIVGNPLIARWFVRRLGLALGLAGFGLGLAGVLLPPTIGAALPLVGWRTIWLSAGLLAAVIAPLALVVMRDRPTEREGFHYLSGEQSAQSRPSRHRQSGGHLRLLEILKRPNFLVLLAVVLPILGAHGGIANNFAPIAMSRGFTQQSAGILLGVLSLAQVVSTLMLGLVSDRYGNRAPLIGLGVVAAAGATIIAASNSFLLLGAGAALIGISGGIWTVVGATLAREFGADFGKANGAVIIFVPLAGLYPFAIARVHEATGSYAVSLLAIAALTVACSAAGLLLREPRRNTQSVP